MFIHGNKTCNRGIFDQQSKWRILKHELGKFLIRFEDDC